MGNGALAIGPKLPRPSSTLPSVTAGIHTAFPELRADRLYHQLATTAAIDPTRASLAIVNLTLQALDFADAYLVVDTARPRRRW